MKKSTKGAIAAAAAGVLLLGGAGTLAYWSDSETVTATNIQSGSLTMAALDCDGVGLHDWQIDGGDPYTPGTTLLVPGDSVSKVCESTLTLTGDHIGADLSIDATNLTDNDASTLDDELTADATFLVDGNAYAPITEPGVYVVQATITVTFDGPLGTNGSQNGDVDLDAINVVADQTHP